MWVDFNINNYVRVQLTDRGRKALREWYEELYSDMPAIKERYPYQPPEEDADGWSKFQMWDLMKLLGSHHGNGLPLVFYTTIQIEVTTLGEGE